jgi:hypothetical protein
MKLRAWSAASTLLLVAAACGGTPPAAEAPPQTTAPPATQPTTTAPTPGPASPAVEVPDVLAFEAPLLGGGTFRGADYVGTDVAFWFWAPW